MNQRRWIIKTFILSFFLAIIFSLGTNAFSSKMSFIILLLLTLLIIFIGIVFDMIGTSILTSNEATFHAMSTKKIKGSKQGVNLIKNSANVSNFCNDVIGDVCGIISGSLSLTLSIIISKKLNISLSFVTMLVAGLISAITIGGKAIGKQIAIKKCDKIVYNVAKILSTFCKNGK